MLVQLRKYEKGIIFVTTKYYKMKH